MRACPRNIVLAVAAGSFLLPVAPVYAVGPTYVLTMPSGSFGSQQYTALVLGKLASAKEFCIGLDQSYRVDCLAERLGVIAKDIPQDSDYVEVSRALKTASGDLQRLARSQRDTSLPTGRATAKSGETSSRPLTPIKSSSLSQINKQVEAILQEAETTLLRSAGTSKDKLVHFQQIADVIDSNKILLRSS